MNSFNYDFNNIHLIGIEGLKQSSIIKLLDRAAFFNSQKRKKKNEILKDCLVINLFFENSTRTKASFEIAAKSMSADILNISVSTSSSPATLKRSSCLVRGSHFSRYFASGPEEDCRICSLYKSHLSP